jgi:hypothetical protein
VVADDFFIPIEDQTPAAGRRLIIRVQIPPLPSANATENPLSNVFSFENITAFEPENYRMAWGQIMIPQVLLNGNRWTALSQVEGGTLYESREIFHGPLGPLLEPLSQEGLQEGFDAQAAALQGLFT